MKKISSPQRFLYICLLVITSQISMLAAASQASIAAPPPGHPSTGESADILNLPHDNEFPYQGLVLQAIDSNDYTYIQVQIPLHNKKIWLAAPKTELKEGQRIRFPSGKFMRNFYSRLLKRTFDGVMFVRAIDIVPELI